jgi:hypothetical protein
LHGTPLRSVRGSTWPDALMRRPFYFNLPNAKEFLKESKDNMIFIDY